MSRINVEKLVLLSCLFTLGGIGLMVLSIVYPKPLMLVISMSMGQGVGVLSLALYLLAIALDLQGGRQAADEDDSRPEALLGT